MWLYLSPSLISQPEQECSLPLWSLHSKQSESMPELFATVSGKAVPRPLSWHGWKRRPYIKLLSGTMQKPSTLQAGVERLISSLPDTRASRSVPLAEVLGTAIRDTCGQRAVERLRELNQASCSLRTSTRTQDVVEEKSFGIAKGLVTKLRADSLARKKLARATRGNGCSFLGWHTPHGFQAGNGPDGNECAKEVKAWPSPRSEDSESCGNHPKATDPLTGATKAWPTPNATDGDKAPRMFGRGNPSLPLSAETWATPGASDSNRGQFKKATKGGRNILTDIATCPTTPQCETTTARGLLQSKLDLTWLRQCNHSAKLMLKPLSDGRFDQAFRDGIDASDERWQRYLRETLFKRLSQKRLNPNFAEWLMGWPVGVTACASSATGWTFWRQDTRSYLCSLVSRND